MEASCKQLKAILALEVRKFGPASIASNLDKFPIFDGFFNFLPFYFSDLDNF